MNCRRQQPRWSAAAGCLTRRPDDSRRGNHAHAFRAASSCREAGSAAHMPEFLAVPRSHCARKLQRRIAAPAGYTQLELSSFRLPTPIRVIHRFTSVRNISMMCSTPAGPAAARP